MSLEHKWYIVHTQAGKEESAKKALENRIKSDNVTEISEIIIPKYKEIVYKDGKRRTVEKKSFPGYLYIKMEYNQESRYFILETPYVSQFVTANAENKNALPRPLTEKEIQGLIDSDKQDAQSSVSEMQIDFEVGQKALIIDGPFNNFSGIIKAIYPDKKKVCVNVEIFGRATPVEIDYFKVKKN